MQLFHVQTCAYLRFNLSSKGRVGGNVFLMLRKYSYQVCIIFTHPKAPFSHPHISVGVSTGPPQPYSDGTKCTLLVYVKLGCSTMSPSDSGPISLKTCCLLSLLPNHVGHVTLHKLCSLDVLWFANDLE